jgi:hypothetical protein
MLESLSTPGSLALDCRQTGDKAVTIYRIVTKGQSDQIGGTPAVALGP